MFDKNSRGVIWSNLCDTSGSVKMWIVNQVRHFKGLQLFGIKRLVERLQLIRIMHVVAQPEVESVGGEDDRHAVMDWCNEGVSSSGQDCKGLKLITVRCFPRFPESGQAHWRLVR